MGTWEIRVAKIGRVLLAVCLAGMAGCAYFTARDGELYASTQMAQREGGRIFMFLPEPNTIGATLLDASVMFTGTVPGCMF